MPLTNKQPSNNSVRRRKARDDAKLSRDSRVQNRRAVRRNTVKMPSTVRRGWKLRYNKTNILTRGFKSRNRKKKES